METEQQQQQQEGKQQQLQQNKAATATTNSHSRRGRPGGHHGRLIRGARAALFLLAGRTPPACDTKDSQDSAPPNMFPDPIIFNSSLPQGGPGNMIAPAPQTAGDCGRLIYWAQVERKTGSYVCHSIFNNCSPKWR